MRILVSGEGVTDMGRCSVADQCCGEAFEAGPMAYLVDQIAETCLGYPFVSTELMSLIPKQKVAEVSKTLRPLRLAGRKRRKETAYFYCNARAMARLAQRFAKETNDEVVAVFFRDADRTRSTERGDWQDKWDSIVSGFAIEGFGAGVPMLPQPKSEAWLLCALQKSQPYQQCGRYEKESGNDDSPNSLKKQLEDLLGETQSAAILVDLVCSGKVDASQIDMPSFNRFRKRLTECLCSWESEGVSK